MLIERYLPTYDVRDYHEARVSAPAHTAYAVLRSLGLNRSWIVQGLFTIRSLPSPPSGPHLPATTLWDIPCFTKIVWAIAARPVTPDVSVLSMETRVLATAPASRRKFRVYWCVVSPGVRLLRRVALHRTRREIDRARPAS